MDPIYSLGLQIIHALQTLSPGLDEIMKAFTFLGTIEFYMILVPLIYWLVDVHLGIRILLVLITTDFAAGSFKQIFRQPRPYWTGEARALSSEASYGIPSSHASDSLSVWGYLAFRRSKTWLWAFSLLLVLFIGLSRLYLGVHFLQDVLTGWLIAAVVIFAFAKSEGKFLNWLKQYPPVYQIGAVFLASLAMILAGFVISALTSASTDPAAWASFSGQARSLTSYFTLGGALFGACAGFVLMKEYAAFQENGPWQELVGRYLVGILGVLILYFGLDFIFAQLAGDESTAGYLLRYLRYAVVTFWATFGAPWLFLKLNLAVPRTEEKAVFAEQLLPVK